MNITALLADPVGALAKVGLKILPFALMGIIILALISLVQCANSRAVKAKIGEDNAKSTALVAGAQATVNAKSITSADKTEAATGRINAQANAASESIKAAHGSSTPIDPSVASLWSSGIDGLRSDPNTQDGGHGDGQSDSQSQVPPPS